MQTNKIREVRENELMAIAKLDASVHLTPWSLDNYQSSYINPKHHIFILELSGQIIGAVVVSVVVDEGEILQLWVKQKWQRHGYAQELLNFVVVFCRKHGVHKLFLEVRSDNTAAIKLYEKFGFVQIGIRPNYYVVESWVFDALLLQKCLDDF